MPTTAHSDLTPVIAAIEKHAGAIRSRGVTALYLYGARARENQRPGSDLDVMVDYDSAESSLHDLTGLQHIIGDETGVQTHVATLGSLGGSEQFTRDLIRVL
jgi:uncharacterized protein